jgi:hypothetical protein
MSKKQKRSWSRINLALIDGGWRWSRKLSTGEGESGAEARNKNPEDDNFECRILFRVYKTCTDIR